MADAVLINKIDVAEPKDVAAVEASVLELNPTATILRANSPSSWTSRTWSPASACWWSRMVPR